MFAQSGGKPSQVEPSEYSTSANKAIPASTPAPIKIGSLTLSGSLRLRIESWDWFETRAANNRYNFGAALLRVAIGQKRERFEWQVEGAFPLLINLPDDAIAPAPQGQLGLGASYFSANGRQNGSAVLKQAFVRFKGLGGDKTSGLKIGRFEFADGSETEPTDANLATIKRDRIMHRLIGPFTFSHIGRSFDGLHYVLSTNGGNLTVVAARPTEGVFQLRSLDQLDVDFYYGAYSRLLKAKESEHDLRVFALHYHDGRRLQKVDNRPPATASADKKNIGITTLGGHYVGAGEVGQGKVDVLLWGAGQFGSWESLKHRAGAIAIEGGYQFGGGLADKIKPWLRAGYFRSSGDGDPDDGTHGTFFGVLPTPRIYARTPFYNLMNIEDTFLQLRLKPHAKLSLRTDARYLRLGDAKDHWYSGGGAFQRGTFGYVGRPSGGSRELGTMVDASVDYNLLDKTTVTFYIAGVRAGRVVTGIYPESRGARFAYLELTRRF